MRKKVVIALSIVFSVLVLVTIVGFIFADVWLTKLVDSKIHEKIDTLDSVHISYSDLDIRLGTGIVRLEDVVMETDLQGKPLLSLSLDRVEIGHFRLLHILKKHELDLSYLEILNPDLQLTLTPKEKQQHATSSPASDEGMERLSRFVNNIGIRAVKVVSGKVRMTRQQSRLQLSANNINLTLNNLHFLPSTRELSYTDSLYHLSLDSLSLTTANGLYALNIDHLKTNNAREIIISHFHGRNTVNKTRLADLQGKIPATWTNMKIERLSTSPVNIIRAIKTKQISINTINIDASELALYRDVRYKPRQPYGMPQEAIRDIPLPVHIAKVNLNSKTFCVEVKREVGEAGTINMHDINATVNSFNNDNAGKFSANLKMRLGQGTGEASIQFVNDKQCTFSSDIRMNDMHGSDLEDFLHPMMGISLSSSIHSLSLSSKGNKTATESSFCMTYDTLNAHVYKEEAPIQSLQKNADLINLFAGIIINQHNPRQQGAQPFTCTTTTPRDEMKNFAEYLMSPLTDGIMHTVFPEFVYQQIKRIQSLKKSLVQEQKIEKN